MSGARRIGAVAWLELLRLFRSRIAITLLLVVPALQVLLFGYAIRPTGGAITVAIAASAPADAAAVARSLDSTPRLRIVRRGGVPGSADAAVHAQKALIAIEVPDRASFANPTAGLQPVRIVVDSSNATLTAGAVPAIEAAYWRALAERGDIADTGPGYRIEQLYNPDARADWTFLPALIGVTMMISMIMLGTLSLAREREAGTWEALLSLPIGNAEILLGKLAPYVVIGSVQGMLVLALGIGLFGLPARGDVVALILLLPLFAAAHLALGLAIAARAATQLAALQGAVAFYLPAMLLSGFLYPFETLPLWAQAVGQVFPLTHFIRAARGVLLRGDGGDVVTLEAWPIAAFLVIALAVALLAQRRRLS
jgi:ABC-2 type transport system permease protein